MRFFSIIGLFFIFCILFFVLGRHVANLTPGVPVEEKTFIVAKSEPMAKVALRLEQANLIHSASLFRWYVRLTGQAHGLKHGEYLLKTNMTNQEVISILNSGKTLVHRFIVPEGDNVFQIAEALQTQGLGNAKTFLAAVNSSTIKNKLTQRFQITNAEGYLFPDTYVISNGLNEDRILSLMLNRFQKMLSDFKNDFEKSQAIKDFHFSMHEVITLASIVEKETGAANERPMIASVFYNRLRKHMRLQSDPTVIYGMWVRDGQFLGNIHKQDLSIDTPYNTYTQAALPAGPIANPGGEAILAVLYPAKTNYLYFVSKNNGTHVFSRTYQEHMKAVRRLQQDPAAREGKSWRDLSPELRANHGGHAGAK